MLITTAQLLLSLSILVVLHELGHFSAAKWFKTKVEKFYLFFNPGFSLFKKQIGETEYGVGWLPLGGYVKIAGMVDESFDMDQLKAEPQPWEFRSKPAWQRLIIMLGGVFVNFVLGVFLFAMILLIWGQSFIPNNSVKHGIAVSELGYQLGLRDGDQLVKIGELPFDKFNDGILKKELVINRPSQLTVNRNGSEISLPVDVSVISELTKYENRNAYLIAPRYPYELGNINSGSVGEAAGLKLDDKIMAVNGEPTPWTHQFVNAMKDKASTTIKLTIQRGGQILHFDLPLDETGKIGVLPKSIDNYASFEKEKYSLGRAIPAGWDKAWGFLTDQLKAFSQMISGEMNPNDSLGSVISIGKMFGTSWDWERFWAMTASLSILLGFLNLLPIPALDGGYVMFLIGETITGKKVPDRVMEIANITGFLLLMLLMTYALGLDISRLF